VHDYELVAAPACVVARNQSQKMVPRDEYFLFP
jgi:hypothetical protein